MFVLMHYCLINHRIITRSLTPKERNEMLFIIVPTYNRVEICRHFLADLRKQSNQNFELVLVDHGKEKVDVTDSVIRIHYIDSDVNGWARAVNVGLRYVLKLSPREGHVLIINDDVLLDESYIQTVYDSISEKPDSVLGTICVDKNTHQTLRVAIRLNRLKGFFTYWYQFIPVKELLTQEMFIESDVLTGKGTVFPISMLNDIGIYCEDKLPHYKADHELVWRAKKAGYDVFASTKMQLFTVSDQRTADGKLSFRENIRFLFYDMRSTINIKDLWNFSTLAFKFPYSLYFYLVNLFRNIAGMLITLYRTR